MRYYIPVPKWGESDNCPIDTLRIDEGKKKSYLDWIYSAKTENTKIERMAQTVESLGNRIKFFDRE
ncbi:MAG: YdeI/OmpD-associated family protein [Saprospiraceae bacterium]